MPNWSYNSLRVSGSAESMAEFYSEAIKEGKFEMSNLFPMPEKIKNTISPSSSAKGRKWMNEDHVSANREGGLSEILGEEPEGLIPCENNTPEKCLALIKEFGADNWYDWNIATYGTKWDISVGEEEFDREPTEFLASFDTAWCPPMQFLERLQQRFPNIDISMTFEVEGSDTCGIAYTDRTQEEPSIAIDEAELEFESSDGRKIFFDEDQGFWAYEETGEECDDVMSINPFSR